MTEVTCTITDAEKQSFGAKIPFAVQVRIILNNHGFRFTDDNKVSSIINEKPEPLGVMKWDYCNKNMETRYRQVF